MSIVILAGGSGNRLQGSSFPKPLNMIYGRPAISYILEKIPADFKHIHFIYSKHLIEFNFETIVTNLCKGRTVTFYRLPYRTRGALESAFLGTRDIDLKGSVFFLDNDVIYNFPDDFLLKTGGSATLGYDIDTSHSEAFSFIRTGGADGDTVIEIAEKRRISDKFACGMYGMKDLKQFQTIAEEVLAEPAAGNEYYMSDLFVRLLQKHETVCAVRFQNIMHIGSKSEVLQHLDHLNIGARRICFDLDNTLVTYPTVPGDYTTVKPIPHMIHILKTLYQQGHIIIIYTARRMLTHRHNVGAVLKDIGRITFDTLETFQIPYDEIVFGKPIADVYIDDRAWNPYTQTPESMGLFHFQTTEDILNKLPNNCHNRIERRESAIIKRGDTSQLEGEIYYYQHIPSEKQMFFPRYLGSGEGELTIEYIEGIPLTFLWLEGLLQKKHIDSVFEFLDSIHSASGLPCIPDSEVSENYTKKLSARFQKTCDYPFENAEKFQKLILERLDDYIARKKYRVVPMIHGDCWFPNLLYTYRNTLKCIDMRGRWGGRNTMSGDAVYDYAKLYQSFLGYDSVIFGYPERNGNRNDLVNYFLAKCSERGVVESDLRTVTLGLLMGCMWSIRADKRKVVWDWIVEKHVSEQIYTLPYQIP